jgi:hypothetical protein
VLCAVTDLTSHSSLNHKIKLADEVAFVQL